MNLFVKQQAGLLLGLCLLLTSACAHVVRVESEPPGAIVYDQGKKVGRTPCNIDVSLIADKDSSHELRLKGYQKATVPLAKTEIEWWWLVAGIAGCAVCSVPACVTGALLANLQLCPTCLGCLITSNLSLLTTAIAAPSVFTVPAMSLGTLIGMTPLGLVWFAERPVRTIKIKLKPKKSRTTPAVAPQASTPKPPATPAI